MRGVRRALRVWLAFLTAVALLTACGDTSDGARPASAAAVGVAVQRLANAEPSLAERLTTRSIGWVRESPAVVRSLPLPPGQVGLRSRLPEGADGAWEVGWGESEDLGVQLLPAGAKRAKLELEGKRAIYREAFRSTDAIYASGAGYVELLLLLHDAHAPNQFAWDVRSPAGALRGRLDPEGGIEFVHSASDRVLFRMLRAFAVDADGRRREAQLALDEGRLSLSLDTSGLSFPVLLDPVIEAYGWRDLFPFKNRYNFAMASLGSKVLVFGGYSSQAGAYLNDTWEWDGTRWTQKNGAVRPPARAEHAMATLGDRIVMFGGWDGVSFFSDTWEWDGISWTRKTPARAPASRSGHVMATLRDRVVLFGGATTGYYDDTWEWDGQTWTNRYSASPPFRRARAGLAPLGNKLVLFGGCTQGGQLSDTWQWDGDYWSYKGIGTGPSAREDHAMATLGGKVVLHGGRSTGSSYSDTWEWNGLVWSQASPPLSPGARMGARMTTLGTELVLFGGGSGADPLLDTWAWNGTTWTQKAGAGAKMPGTRSGHAMAANDTRALLFGGGWPPSFSDYFQDTWEFDGVVWQAIPSATSPPARAGHAMAPVGANFLLFGGKSATETFGDTWEWGSAGGWVQRATTGAPKPRFGHAMVAVGTKVLLFGGYNADVSYLDDTWVWNGGAWYQYSPAMSPSARRDHAMAAVGTTVLLFGGRGSSGSLSDTWRWDGATWKPLSTRWMDAIYDHGMATFGSRVLLFGGYRSPPGVSTSETFEWNGNDWIPLYPSPRPSTRSDHTLVSLGDRALLFGGAEAGRALGDTWDYAFARALGSECSTGSECLSGNCVDGRCCNSWCGGGDPSDCQACSVAAGGMTDGTCSTLAATHVCRSAVGPCDRAEACTGSSGSCPPDGVEPSTATCRPALGSCDQPEFCDGLSTTCAEDAKLPEGAICRPALSDCDLDETCDGSSDLCPDDRYLPAETPCADDGEPCTQEACDGFGSCAHLAGNVGAVCRPPAGDCDLVELCDGVSTACPADLKSHSGQPCRAAAGACDAPESCDGLSAACPPDDLLDAGTECRPAVGECDLAETCTGGMVACPPDLARPPGSACGPAPSGDCDAQDSCEGEVGASATCVPRVLPDTAVCREAVGECDREERCTGLSAICPSDAAAAPGTACGSPLMGDCDAQDVCVGEVGASATCEARLAMSTTLCREAAGPCDPAEHCSGMSPSCPADVANPPGAPCLDDALACTLDVCDEARACRHRLTTGCLIDGTCVATGAADPASECRICDPTLATDGYSNKPRGLACSDDGLPNTDDLCDGAGACTHRLAGECVIEGTVYPSGAADPANPCQACEPASSISVWTPRVARFPCTSDGLDCTADVCDGAGVCEHPLLTGCLLDGACVAAGAPDPANDCLACDPSVSTTSFSVRPRGLACADDGSPVTDDVCDGAGGCAHPVRGECVIEGVAYPGGAANPANRCEACQPATSVSTWTARVAGFPCESDGLACTADVCDGAGTCAHPLSTGCLIGGACVAAGAADPEGDCRSCDPARSTTGYSDTFRGLACADDGSPLTDDICDGAGACTHPLRGECAIAGTIYRSGAANPANACESCEPSVSVSAWSPRVAGFPCGTDGACGERDGVPACLCRPGAYDSGEAACAPCPAGAFRAGPGGVGAEACTPCPSETFGPFAGATALESCLPCPAGTTAGPGATSCEACPVQTAGWGLPGLGCAPCSLGTYSPVPNLPACLQCPPGSHTPLIPEGAAACSPCAAGTAQSAFGASACEPCAPGEFAADGERFCTACPPGSFSGMAAGRCTPCASGTFAMMPRSTSCLDCPEGTFSPEPGSAFCQLCPSGSFAGATGAHACETCPAGTVQPQPGAATCDPCVAGTYAAAGQPACSSCPPGSFSLARAEGCTPCAAGTFADAPMSDRCLECPPGHFNPSPGGATCQRCPAGTHASASRQLACEDCPPGTMQSGMGQPECTPCPPGTYSPVARQATCMPCPPGYESTVDGTSCAPVCGDGQRAGNEDCDDGNTASADGCGSSCITEAGWACPSAGRPCVRTCLIDGVLHLAGALSPANPCQACDPATSTTAWSPRRSGSACSEDELACTVGRCGETGACEQQVVNGCLVAGACVAIGGLDPANECRACDPARSTSSFSTRPRGLACSDDGAPTTEDVCDGTGACIHPLRGECLIGGVTYASGAANPAYPCESCEPARSVSTWTARVDGFPCASDELSCTADVCDGAGTCEHRLFAGCRIGGACVLAGAADPENECRACDPAVSTSTFSARPRGLACADDGLPTTDDRCDGVGACTHPPRGACEIDGASWPSGTANPANPCESCEPARSVSSWTARVDGFPCTSDGLACTADVCNGTGGCENRLFTGCRIAGACIATGATDPENQCRACDPGRSTTAYSDRARGLACADDGSPTTEDVCDGAGACTHPLKGECLIDGARVPGGSSDPENPCRSCDPSRSVEGWTARSEGFPCATDGLACTADVCDGTGNCAHPLFAGCLIAGTCVATGAADPANECRACDPARSAVAYSDRARGLACTDDGSDLTYDVCNGVGACLHPLKGECLIDGASVAGGSADPANPCRSCEPSTSVTSWTPRIAGFPCASDDLACTADVCDGAGACEHPLFTGCRIADACVAPGAVDPENGCRACDPARSTSAYSDRPRGLACSDDGSATTEDVCDGAGVCLHPLKGECFIDGMRVPGGTPDPANACRSCEPARSVDSWSHRVEGFPCGGDGLACTADVCDGTGACDHRLFSGCLIDGACVAAGAADPSSECRICRPGTSTSSYEDQPDGTPCSEDGEPDTLDVCASGRCIHRERSGPAEPEAVKAPPEGCGCAASREGGTPALGPLGLLLLVGLARRRRSGVRAALRLERT